MLPPQIYNTICDSTIEPTPVTWFSKRCPASPRFPMPLTSGHGMLPHHAMPRHAGWVRARRARRSSTGRSSASGSTGRHVHTTDLLVLAASKQRRNVGSINTGLINPSFTIKSWEVDRWTSVPCMNGNKYHDFGLPLTKLGLY